MSVIELRGCTTEPLGNYLKALGVFRLVAEQADPQALAWWKDSVLWLRSRWSNQEIADFFHSGVGDERRPIYAPTPIFAPWGGRPGFYDDGNREAKSRLERLLAAANSHSRFSTVGRVIRATCDMLRDRNWAASKPHKEKLRLAEVCRSVWPEPALAWFDACLAIEEETRFGFLFGTGGNEGSADITNNFWELIEEVLGLPDPQLHSHETLNAALFDEPRAAGTNRTAGQHFPSACGSPNVGQGFNGSTSTNPWDVVLMMEGCILFAGALTKRLSQHGKGKAAFPFMIDHVAAEAPGETAREEAKQDGKVVKCRAEFWMPMWERPCSLLELKALLAEGRLQRRNGVPAEHSVRAMEAIAGLGVSRGISRFRRVGLFERRGKGYYIASSLGEFVVPNKPAKSLDFIEELDGFRDQEYRRIREGPGVPDRMIAAKSRLERSVARVLTTETRTGEVAAEQLLDVLTAAAALEWEVSLSKDRARLLQPCPSLRPRWLHDWAEPKLNDGSAEFRLARSIAAIAQWGEREGADSGIPVVDALRANLIPVSRTTGQSKFWNWDDRTRSNVWSRGASLLDNLASLLQRRLIDASKGRGTGLPLSCRFGASFTDLLTLWNGEINESRLAGLIHGLSLVGVPLDSGAVEQADSTPDLAPTGLWFDGNDKPHVSFESPIGLHPDELRDAFALPRAYAFLKLLFVGGRLPARPVERRTTKRTGEEPYPHESADVLNLLLAGRAQHALVRGAQKLKGKGYPPLAPDAALRSREFGLNPADSRRLAGLLLIPVHNPGVLAALAIKPQFI